MDVLTIAAGKAWALLVSVFPMFFGVAISLNVNSEKTSHMSTSQLASAFFLAWESLIILVILLLRGG